MLKKGFALWSRSRIIKVFWLFDITPLKRFTKVLILFTYCQRKGSIQPLPLRQRYSPPLDPNVINSKLHHGLPTDRFRIEWILNDKFLEKIKNYNKEIDSDSEDIKYIDIPLNIQELKNKDLDKAIEWRIKTRELFDKYIVKQNFIVVDYIVDMVNKKGVYVLKNFDNKNLRNS